MAWHINHWISLKIAADVQAQSQDELRDGMLQMAHNELAQEAMLIYHCT